MFFSLDTDDLECIPVYVFCSSTLLAEEHIAVTTHPDSEYEIVSQSRTLQNQPITMQGLNEFVCRYPVIERFTRLCNGAEDVEETGDKGRRRMVERQNTAPDGQVLPEWMTWVAVSPLYPPLRHGPGTAE